MARSSSNSKRGRRGHRANSAYLGLAVVTFIAILVALFWGRSAGPHEAAAGGGSPAKAIDASKAISAAVLIPASCPSSGRPQPEPSPPKRILGAVR